MFTLAFTPPILAISALSLLLAGCKAPSGPDPKAPQAAPIEKEAEPERRATENTPGNDESDQLDHLTSGSRLRIWLPFEVKRMGRALVYRTPDASLVVAVAELSVPKSDVDEMLRGIIAGAGEMKPISDGQRNGDREVLLSGEKSGKEARMLILERDGSAATIYVVASPEQRENANRILASVELDEKAELDPVKIHGLKLGPLGNMEVGQGTHQPIVLSRKGRKAPPDISTAVAFISIQPHNYGAEITDEQLGQLMGASLSQLAPNFETAKSNPITIGGRDVHELLLQGKKGQTPLAIYAYAIADGDTAIVAVAYVQMDQADQELSDVVPLLRSLTLTPL